MNLTILVIVAYFTNGTPLATTFYIDPARVECSAATALRYTREHIVPMLPEGHAIQSPEETMLWTCLPVPPGTPGPAARHIPTDNEA